MTASGRLWAYVPAALLTAMVGGLALMARIAADDPSFSVEPNYYARAVAWDAHREQLDTNARLGWKLEAEPRRRTSDGIELEVELSDRSGSPIERAKLDVEAFHNARAANVLTTALGEAEKGRYVAALPMTRSGLWELRFTASRGRERFTDVVRLELP